MSVQRSITIRLLTKEKKFSDLFESFVIPFWVEKLDFIISSLRKDDTDLFDYVDYIEFNMLKTIIDYREKRGYSNHLSFKVEVLDDSISISSRRIKEKSLRQRSEYELIFTPGIGKRIENADRFTDYGFYLNTIIPRLIEIGCQICEIECNDLDC